MVKDNPLPAVLGRVCYHPCESACNRSNLDSVVSIRAVERFLGDLAAEQGWPVPVAPATGKRVLVVGAGPSGLAAAYHLRRLGHGVEIHEAAAVPGGMMHFGIPAHRLPREDLMKEISRIEAMGVKIVLNSKVQDVVAARLAGNYDAVFVAIGPQIGKHIDTPASDRDQVPTAIGLPHSTQAGKPSKPGQQADNGFVHQLPGIAFNPDGTVIVASDMMTGAAGIFAGGYRVVTSAVGYGKRAARNIDAWFEGRTYAKQVERQSVSFNMLHLPIYAAVQRSTQKEVPVAEHMHDFDEILAGLSQASALHEAKRCLSCGNCFECDNCFAACPEDAIEKLGPGRGYRIDMSLCTGCAVCVEQCPCHAMEMIPEPTQDAQRIANKRQVAYEQEDNPRRQFGCRPCGVSRQ